MMDRDWMQGLRRIPVVGFLVRYWLLLVLLAAAVALLRWEAALQVLGVFVHLPVLVALVATLGLAARHLVNRSTTEPYSRSGELRREWRLLEPWQRVLIFKIELWVWFLVLAILGHSLLG